MISHKYKLFFLHPPKCGGTSIEIALEPDRASDNQKLRKGKHNNANMYKNKYPEHWDIYTKVTIIRNPFSRVLSLYNYFMNVDHLNDTQHRLQFAEFLNSVFVEKTFRCEGNESIQNGLKCFLTSGGKYQIDLCMKLENINNDIKELEKITNCKLDLPHYNGHKPASGRSSNNYRNMYSKEHRELLENIYKSDLNFYNYQF